MRATAPGMAGHHLGWLLSQATSCKLSMTDAKQSDAKMDKNNSRHQQNECLRCGRCCLADFAAYVSKQDIQRWQAQGRTDILQVLENEQGVWQGDHLVNARSGKPLRGCPFFFFDGKRFGCAIHETRPATCRNYVPGSSELCPLYAKADVSSKTN